jgi:hypothetical protein
MYGFIWNGFVPIIILHIIYVLDVRGMETCVFPLYAFALDFQGLFRARRANV